MTKKWIAINLLLLLVAGLLGWQLRVSVLQYEADNDLAKIQPVRDLKQKIVGEKSLPPLVTAKTYNPADFSVIPDNNLFSESRSRDDKTDAQGALEVPPLAQKPILVGVTISENQCLASVIDPLSPPQAQGRRAQIKRIGDVYQGYTITDITSEHMVLDSGTRKEIIKVHEGTKRNQGGKTPILSTRVVAFGAGGAGGGTSVAVVSGGVGTQKPPTVPATTPAAVAAAQPGATRPTATTTQVRQAPGNVQQPAPQPQVQQQLQPAPQGGTQGTRTIRTPFGDIIRPNQ
jgi:hypothetical protein